MLPYLKYILICKVRNFEVDRQEVFIMVLGLMLLIITFTKSTGHTMT